MEYRRRRYRRSSEKTAGGGTALQAFVLLLIFGAIIYAVFGTGLGKKLKDEYAVSLYDKLTGKTEVTPPPSLVTDGAIVTEAPTPAPTAVPTGESYSLSLPELNVFMLQMGVYQTAEEAAKKAAELISLGAAGYLYDDQGSLRLIAAAYSDEASAESVRSRLTEEGYACSVFKLSRKGVDLIITAAPERLLPVRTAFALASDVVSQLDELSIDFDANGRSAEYGLSVLAEIRDNLRSAQSGISGAAEQNPMLALVNECLTDYQELVTETMTGAGTGASFASALKTLRIKAALRYSGLLQSIGE